MTSHVRTAGAPEGGKEQNVNIAGLSLGNYYNYYADSPTYSIAIWDFLLYKGETMTTRPWIEYNL